MVRKYPQESNLDINRIAIAVLTFLRDHPQAKDTAKGVAEWWVSEEKEMVEMALPLLVKKGQSKNMVGFAD